MQGPSRLRYFLVFIALFLPTKKLGCIPEFIGLTILRVCKPLHLNDGWFEKNEGSTELLREL